MAASPSALSSAQLLANFPPSTPEKEAQSRKTLGVCITTIAAGILLGGGLIAGGGLLFARVAPMPMHTHSILLYRLAYGLAATGIFALGGLCTV